MQRSLTDIVRIYSLEPLGVLVFSIIMMTSFFQVGLECISRLMSSEHAILELSVPQLPLALAVIRLTSFQRRPGNPHHGQHHRHQRRRLALVPTREEL